MKRTITITAIAIALASAVPALAGGDNPRGEAREMADALQGGGGGNNSQLKSDLELTGNGGVASYVSGKNNVFEADGVRTGGWGNVGSTQTGVIGNSVSGR